MNIPVKFGQKVRVHVHECSDYDNATLSLNDAVYQFPLPEPGTIDITDHLHIGTPNDVVMRIHNQGGGIFGEPSKWKGRFAIWVDSQTYGPFAGEGDDWGNKTDHVVGRATITVSM